MHLISLTHLLPHGHSQQQAVIKQTSLLTVHPVFFHLWIGREQLMEAFSIKIHFPSCTDQPDKPNKLRKIVSGMENDDLYQKNV